MRILVTGSSGTIGTRLCEKLLEKGYDVIGMDWKPNKWNKDVQNITTHIDLRNSNALQPTTPSAISSGPNGYSLQPDTVIHLAANARVYELVEDPSRARDNVLTTFNVLEWARKQGVRKFLFASSRETYGNAGAQIYREDMADFRNCESPYTASKIAGEALVEAYTRCYNLDHVIFRFSNVYGMYDDSERVIPLFIRRARKNEPLVIYGREKCLDFTYIDDTVDGVLRTLERFDTAKNDTYNIAYGTGTTIETLAETVRKFMSSSSRVRYEESRTGEVVRFTADITKAREKLGYAPQTSFEEGIRKTVEWYKTHEKLRDQACSPP